MKIRDLIHELTQQYIHDLDAEVAIRTSQGIAVIDDVRTDNPWGAQRVFIETRPPDQGHWAAVWNAPESAAEALEADRLRFEA